MAKRDNESITEGSGNVFADLGFENAEEMLAKAELVLAISRVIDSRQLSQAKVAEIVGIDQPQVSKLLRGRTGGYSTDRLMRILNSLGQDVEITVRPKPATEHRAAHVTVNAIMAKVAAIDRVPQVVREKKKPYRAK